MLIIFEHGFHRFLEKIELKFKKKKKKKRKKKKKKKRTKDFHFLIELLNSIIAKLGQKSVKLISLKAIFAI